MAIMIPKRVREWFDAHEFGEPVEIQPVGGGCINNGMRLETSSGDKFFLKINKHAPEDMFEREMEGLKALDVPDGPKVPSPYLSGLDFILMEDLQPARKGLSYWKVFGRQMAVLHKHTSPQFGFEADNYIGSTPQSNNWTDDGYEFFAKQRLIYQVELAFNNSLISGNVRRAVERLAARLSDLIPPQPASLIHGDLWSGNATSDRHGNPAIIDPAAHYGWGEADLAMTALFGIFPNEFYRGYNEVRRLENGFKERFPIYNLYHLINHVNLFGGSYLSQVNSILKRFS